MATVFDPVQRSARAERFTEVVVPWCRERAVRLCVLYGSRALGTDRPTSDVDLALWVTPRPEPGTLLTWYRELTRAFDLEVQLVLVTSRLDPVLGFEIARQGVALFESDPGVWASERLRLWHLYQDSRPFLRLAHMNLAAYVEGLSRGA